MKKVSKLQRQIFTITTALALFIILLLGISISSILYTQGIDSAETVLRNKNRSVTTLMLGYFAPLRQAVEYSTSPDSGIDHSRFEEHDTRQAILNLFEVLQKTIPNVNYIFSGYEDGSLLINNYTPPADFNAVDRPWYQAALDMHPLISDGMPYQDIISKEWLVSFGKTLLNANEEIIGVLSIDAGMDTIIEALSVKDQHYPTVYNYVLNTQGMVLIHPDEGMRDTFHQGVYAHLPSADVTRGSLNYRDEGRQFLAHFDRIETLGWIVVTEVNLADIRQPIMKTIIFTLLMIVTGSLLATWLMSFVLSRHIIAPLKKLQNRVQEITEGNSDKISEYTFPNNEIGMISEAIEQLTENALIHKNVELKIKNLQLDALSNTDQLTEIANRRKMLEIIQAEINRFDRHKTPFSIFMFDVDHFKRVNDTFGHDLGDQVLVDIARVVRSSIRRTDTLGRWGGEEFILICPETELNTAHNVAEKVCSAIRHHAFPANLSITVSLGLSEFRSGHTLETILAEIDQKMYRAKQNGRNRIEI